MIDPGDPIGRLALIADIHGNDVALTAVLDDIERRSVDHVICLGDVATLGPHPKPVVRALMDLECPCVLGNHDEFLLDPGSIHAYSDDPVILASVDWCRDQLSASDLDYLRTLRPTLEVALGVDQKVLAFHGSPRSNVDNILATSDPDEVDAMLADHDDATILVGGHTHIQMLRQHRGRLIVNPGSVGSPFREFVGGRQPSLLDHAEYGIIDVSHHGVRVEMFRVALDRADLRASVEASEAPLRDFYLSEYAEREG